MQFKQLEVIPSITKALEEKGFHEATPIQQKAIPAALAGRDLLASSQTGTGKTAAFAIPIIQMLSEADRKEDEKNQVPQGWAKKKKKKHIRSLIITPTRELAIQIYDNFCIYGKHTKVKTAVIFGGVSQKPQEEQIKRGIDVLIATPGRLADLINQQIVDIHKVEHLVLDETDRMLDMGFLHDVRKIIDQTPKDKQILLFSATFPTEIRKLAKSLLNDPVTIQIQPDKPTVDKIDQHLFYVDKNNKPELLMDILSNNDIKSCIVFTRTKYGADKLVRKLDKKKIKSKAIHGDKSQGARQTALQEFTDKKIRVLVATDVAARGIDIKELAYVVNFDLPEQAETYIHRIGRTGRAGSGGTAISFCSIDEKQQLADIERLLRRHIPVVEEHPFPMEVLEPSVKVPREPRGGRGQRSGGRAGDAGSRDSRDSRGASGRNGRRGSKQKGFSEKELIEAGIRAERAMQENKVESKLAGLDHKPKKLDSRGNEYIPKKRFQPGKPGKSGKPVESGRAGKSANSGRAGKTGNIGKGKYGKAGNRTK